MIASMTGYGTAEIDEDGYRFAVEMRSNNGRFCEVSVRLPSSIAVLEPKIAALVQKKVSRGRVNVSITRNGVQKAEPPSLDVELARAYRDSFVRLKEDLRLEGEVDLELLSGIPDIFSREVKNLEAEEVWPVLEKVCNAALDDFNQMREAEGKVLYEDFVQRIEALEDMLCEVEGLAPLRVERVREHLQERIKDLLQTQGIDETRLAMEVALFADRSDITEECVRLRSHNKQFLEALQQDAPGRRLNFLLQEMNREANTIGAKANDADIAFLVVRMKEEIEKLREQVQNVE